MFLETKAKFDEIFENRLSHDEIREYFLELYERGETASEFAGAASSMRDYLIPLPISEDLREKAIELGVPVGPDFGRLHNGETITIEGKEITPDMVLGPHRTGKKITYSGDTRPTENLVKLAENSNILIHESTYEISDEEKAINNAHSTSKDAAKIAEKANVKHLILTHFSTRYINTDTIKEEATAIFPNTTVAFDFLKIEL